LPNCIEKPTPEHPLVKENILKTDLIQVGLLKESFLIVFPIKNCEPDNWDARKNDVV
jgi:hypothetical protein